MSKIICSVIIPVFNCEKYLLNTIESVLIQSFKEFEIIIIDDCSRDDSYNVAKKISETDSRIKLFRNEENLGVAKTRNKGIHLAQGKYISLLDSDDVWAPAKLEKQVKYMEVNECKISYTAYEMIDSDNNRLNMIYKVPNRINYKNLLKRNIIGCSSVMVDRDFFLNHLVYTETSIHEDYITWLNMLKDVEEAFGINEVLMRYRLMNGTRSRNKIKSSIQMWSVYRKHLKLNILEASWCFLHYVTNGIFKYKQKIFK